MASILDSLLSHLPSPLLDTLARGLHEGKAETETGLRGFLGALLAGLLEKDGATLDPVLQRLPTTLPADAMRALLDGAPLADVDGFLKALFDTRVGGLAQAGARAGNIAMASAVPLLGLAASLLATGLRERLPDDQLRADQVRTWIGGHRAEIASAVPPGTPGLSGAYAAAPRSWYDRHGWVAGLPVLALIVAGVGALVQNGTPTPRAAAEVSATVATESPVVTPAINAAGDASAHSDTGIGLDAGAHMGAPPPAAAAITAGAETAAAANGDGFYREYGGFKIRGLTGGAEQRLIDFIEAGTPPCTDPLCWFSLDRVTFETASAEIDMTRSGEQLVNILTIMIIYPDIQLKIGGYTDNVGDEAANLALSSQRAQAIKTALVGMGVAAERLHPEGYGSAFPVASNDTEEGRAQNRRIDVRVRDR